MYMLYACKHIHKNKAWYLKVFICICILFAHVYTLHKNYTYMVKYACIQVQVYIFM